MHRLTGPTVAAIALCITMFAANDVSARDPDGRYANSPLKQWFDQLASGKGLCCSFADGFSVQDVDWTRRTAAIGCDCKANGSSCPTKLW